MSVQASSVLAQSTLSDEKPSSLLTNSFLGIQQNQSPYYRLDDEILNNLHRSHFELTEERNFHSPSERSLLLTQKQVQSFDCNTVTVVPRDECEALVALYESTNGAGWTRNDNWLQTTTVDDWYGIFVSMGHVRYIVLNENNLTGEITASLGNMVKLEKISLEYNQLKGSIPATLGNLTLLLILDFDYNQLTGTIPSELGNLKYLMNLSLKYNQLTGTVPSELGNLPEIIFLYLNNNRLTGTIPAELGSLPKLLVLELSNNQFTGSIPSALGNLETLTYLELSNNLLANVIPAEIGNLTKLRHLNLRHNHLEGEVPLSFINLINLCVDGLPEEHCYGDFKTDLGYNLLNVPQPNPPSDFLYEKDPDWDKTQGQVNFDYLNYFPAILN